MDRSLGSTKEYTVKLCTDPTSRTHIMRFPMPGGLDLASLENPRLERQLPAGVVRDDNAPEFGAGTEYGQKEREEARRRRRSAYRRRVPTADDFPWLLRSGKKKEKSKYTGRKEGGIQQSASYYLFREVDSDTFEAVPVSSWYNFTPNINYDTLTAEEAEQQFEKRHKTLNYHAVMVQKRLQGTAEGEDSQLSGEAATAGAATGGRSLKTLMGDGLQVREDEEWAMSDSDSDGSGNEGNSKPSKKKPARKTKKKQSRGSDESEPNDEESDDPDVEQSKEVDYISDGTSEEENTGGYAADEEPKLAKKKEQDEESAESDANSDIGSSGEESSEDDLTKSGRETKKLLNKGNRSDLSSDEDDEEEEDYDQLASSKISQAKSNDLKPGAKGGRDSPALAAPGSRSASPAPGKLAKGTFKGKSKAGAGQTEEPAAKKKKPLPPSGAVPAPVNTAAAKASKDDVVTEEAVRRYLSRKPMTTKDLLKKFKGKTSMDGEQLVTALGEILRKINPDRAKVRDQVLLSIKA